jgi:hypothetical protein
VRPYRSVRVSFANGDYDSVCETYGGGPAQLAAWRDLGDLLAHRAGWHLECDVGRGEVLWSLGLLGESRLNVHVGTDGQFICFDYAQDAETSCAGIAAVNAWLFTREDEAGKPSDALLELAQADDWNLLKRYRHRLSVTWSDGHYSASLPHLHDASFGATLAQAVNRAAEMFCQLLGAPADLAPLLAIDVELDETATAQVRGSGGS